MSVSPLNDGSPLPSGWSHTTAGNFRRKRSETFNPTVALEGDYELWSIPSHATGAPEIVAARDIGSNKQHVTPGDVLISRINPRLNRTWVVGSKQDHVQIASTEWIVFPLSQALDSRFLATLLSDSRIKNFLAANASGVGGSLTRVRPELFDNILLPIPPLKEQRRIICRIEALFDEIDRGVESLRDAKWTIDLYRQSLLKYAFEGRLTAEWRAENPDKLESPGAFLARIREERESCYKAALGNWEREVAEWRERGEVGRKPAKPKRPKLRFPDHARLQLVLPELPYGWTWSHLGHSSSGPEYGTAAKSSASGEVAVLRMGNIQNGRFDWSDLVYTSDQEQIERYSLQPGDVLFNRTNSPELVGKTAIYRGERPALFAGYLVRVNHISQITLGPYIAHFLNSPLAREHGKSVKTDGVNQSNINATKLQEYPFPFCSLAEQAEVVRILDTILEATEALDREIDANLARAEALRQSILKKAFSGQLLPQDPNDEPAATLLQRIEAENAPHTPKRGITEKTGATRGLVRRASRGAVRNADV